MTDWINDLSNIVVAGVAVATAVFAWRGLSAWRLEKLWKDDHDVARRLLVALAKYKYGVEQFRFFGLRLESLLSGEGDELSAVNADGATGAKLNAIRMSRIYEGRYQGLVERIVELETVRAEAWALWGEEVDSLVKPLINLNDELVRAVQEHLIMLDPDTDDRKRIWIEKNGAARREYVWDTLDEDDAFRARFVPLYKEAEDKLRVKMGRERGAGSKK